MTMTSLLKFAYSYFYSQGKTHTKRKNQVALHFEYINISLFFPYQVPTRALFYVFLVMSDFMALHFFFLIRTEGSWLEIGTSLSHYIISMATTLFLILLLFMAKFLTNICLRKPTKEGEFVLPQVSVGRPHRD